MSEDIDAFARYATSTAFRIDLSRKMALTLWLVAAIERGRQDIYHLPGADSTVYSPDNFIGAVRALMRRGLVVHRPAPKRSRGTSAGGDPTFFLTPPAWLVLDLLVMAKIVPALPANDAAKPKRRRA